MDQWSNAVPPGTWTEETEPLLVPEPGQVRGRGQGSEVPAACSLSGSPPNTSLESAGCVGPGNQDKQGCGAGALRGGVSTPPYLPWSQDAEQPVQKDLQPDGNRLGSVQDQRAQVKDPARQSHLHWAVAGRRRPVGAELLQGCSKGSPVSPAATMETHVCHTNPGLSLGCVSVCVTMSHPAVSTLVT